MYISFEGRPTKIEPASDRMCLIYDPRDGQIVHYHRVVTLPGGTESSLDEIEKIAFETARLKHNVGGLRPLHLTTEEFGGDREKAYRVNTRLMAVEEATDSKPEDIRTHVPARQNYKRNILLGVLAGSAVAYLLTRKER